ncbi:hypothetical protein [Ochrobactrum sp. 3-3]|uniref:hypothetical protein n=1 Tax=Ochrobactrum sp. 3-3 TaxID=1830124 RepID=UPI000DEF80E0|nr:hypothetical protein [Ochrobactrum sp. 3-3]
MLPEKLKTMADEVAAQPMRPTLILNAQGLLFRDEVEAALSEIWHPREYVMIYDHSTPAVLNSISLKLHMAPRPAPPDEEETAIMAPLVDSPGTQSVAPPKSNMVASTVDKQLRGLKHAVWILAAAIVLAALIR